MIRTNTFLATALLSIGSLLARAPGVCPPGQSELIVSVVPDGWPSEISWTLTQDGNMLAIGSAAGGSTCVTDGECMIFTMMDSFGDGITGAGGYTVTLGGVLVASGGNGHGNNYTYTQTTEINCPPGFSCGSPMPVSEGVHEAPTADTWYSFTATVSGVYLITTCNLASCDTRIWVYDHCSGLVPDESPAGTMYYADGGCNSGPQAELSANLGEGESVYIRIGDSNEACMETSIPWSVSYVGPISGCTDFNSCNFDPLATVDDGSCIAWGSIECPQAPDLIVDQNRIVTSLNLSTYTADQGNCYIAEGCLTGYGDREILRFSTRIANIGQLDYYIGTPAANPDQFELVNCHGHTHYKGYAEYLLYDGEGQELAIGFKNGFCVMDIDCAGGGTSQYGCGNMGISAGCADVYSSGTSCNWLDITGVPEGTYTLVVRTNWDNDPDALGRMESDHFNNWAQVCIFIDRTPTLAITIDSNCDPYVDCQGEIYGPAQMDCLGTCAGTALIGDLNADAAQNAVDVNLYMSGIMGDDLSPLPCIDIDQDGHVTVTDAALMSFCNYWNIYNHPPDSAAVHDHCNFPFVEIINPFDQVTFTIGALDMSEGWMDIHVRNPNRRMLGYELMLSGVQITDVESLYDPVAYPATPAFAFGTGHLMCLSQVDSLIERGPEFKPLCRVHFMESTALICIEEVIDVVNENYHNSVNSLENACATITGVGELGVDQGIRVFPNPFTDRTTVLYPPSLGELVSLNVFDNQGRIVQRQMDPQGTGKFTVDGSGLASGAYHYQLTGAINGAGKLHVEH
ncbi:MAG: T9SS type A sorting domain-containing protein [Flavobacteriales bacterium]|nr:T9SS type A sorting domain-containing protein [Flavobacteriales bacterium]MBK7618173.1 T9SS type A sorting domain-containing protein [Flavobacteriales bacterium]